MSNIRPKIEAKITLLLREQDINLLLKAIRKLRPDNTDEARHREYLLDVLEILATEQTLR